METTEFSRKLTGVNVEFVEGEPTFHWCHCIRGFELVGAEYPVNSRGVPSAINDLFLNVYHNLPFGFL